MGKLKWIFFALILISGTLMVNCNKMDALEGVNELKKDSVLTDIPKDTSKTAAIKDSVITVIKDTINIGVIKDTTTKVIIKDTSATVIIDTTKVQPVQILMPSINLIFDGDSQTKRGHYSAKTIELLKAAGYTNIVSSNFAVSGQNTNNMISDASVQVVPSFNSKYKKNIVCYWIGANDAIRDELTDTAKLYRYLRGYYLSLKKAGFVVLMINLPDANHHVGTNKINAFYSRERSKISDIYVNCRETGGAFEKNKNLQYYETDGVHLNIAGFRYLASKYVYPKLKYYLSK